MKPACSSMLDRVLPIVVASLVADHAAAQDEQPPTVVVVATRMNILYSGVEHYRPQLLRNCSAIFDGVSTEGRATTPMKEALSGARAGDTVQITDIRAGYPDGTSKALRPLRSVVP